MGDFKIVLQKAEPGTQYAQNIAYVLIREPFKSYRIEFEDGTPLRDIDIMANETALTKDKGIFQEVNGDELTIIPDGATIPYTFTLEDVPEDAFDKIQNGDIIELMRGKFSKKYILLGKRLNKTRRKRVSNKVTGKKLLASFFVCLIWISYHNLKCNIRLETQANKKL